MAVCESVSVSEIERGRDFVCVWDSDVLDNISLSCLGVKIDATRISDISVTEQRDIAEYRALLTYC